jgi:hypothetical protein
MGSSAAGYDPPVGPEHGADGTGGDDPFEGLTLDEEFIRSAPVREPAAVERERAAREANLSRLLADEVSRRENETYELRRQAPSDADFDAAVARHVPPARKRGRRPLQAVALFVALSLVVVYVMSDYFRSGGSIGSDGAVAGTSAAPGAASPPVEVGASPGAAGTLDGDPVGDVGWLRPDDWPPLPEDVPTEPLGRPGPVPGGGGPHEFVQTQQDGITPVGYDPCRPVAYVTRPGGPSAGDQMVAEAIAMVSAATGLQFVDEGRTDEPPSDEREAYQPERYGERWAPVLIAWSDAEESPRLGQSLPDMPLADVAGYAGSRSAGLSMTDPTTGVTTTTGQVFVTGSVVLDGPDRWRRSRSRTRSSSSTATR